MDGVLPLARYPIHILFVKVYSIQYECFVIYGFTL
ncbi:MAG: hypothetical protein H6Q70_2549 [Firmicutes bacterium]|nr:hypothetical protein [Bacillota bacterium]